MIPKLLFALALYANTLITYLILPQMNSMSDFQAAPVLLADHESCEASQVANDTESNLSNIPKETPEVNWDLNDQTAIDMAQLTKKKRSRRPKSKRGKVRNVLVFQKRPRDN